MKTLHAGITLLLGCTIGLVWLRTFWNQTYRVPGAILAAPIAVGLIGLSHWVTYDFSFGHWAGDFSLLQAIFNTCVAVVLLYRRSVAVSIA